MSDLRISFVPTPEQAERYKRLRKKFGRNQPEMNLSAFLCKKLDEYMDSLENSPRRPKPVIIFAGNTPEFYQCCHERHIKLRDAINADLPDQIACLRADDVDEIIYYGTYHQHKHFNEIIESFRRLRFKREVFPQPKEVNKL